MENKLEQLLNSLIKKGRVPFGIYGNGDLEGERIYIEEQDEYTNEYRNKIYWINTDYVEFNGLCDEDKHFSDRFSLREIVSKGSGLWQFVCENGMTNNVGNFVFRRLRDGKKFGLDKPITHYTFRVLESSLKDESELEDFLLQNIKVGD